MRPVAALFGFALAACSSATRPDPPLTLHVTNATCNTGPCTHLQILAYDQSIQNNPPPGGWYFALGQVDSASACLTMPPSGTFIMSGKPIATFTTADAFTLSARDSASLTFQGETAEFVPQDAPGWSVTFDTAPVRPSGPMAITTACTP